MKTHALERQSVGLAVNSTATIAADGGVSNMAWWWKMRRGENAAWGVFAADWFILDQSGLWRGNSELYRERGIHSGLTNCEGRTESAPGTHHHVGQTSPDLPACTS